MNSTGFRGGLIVGCVVVGLLAIRSLIPARQATQAGSDWTSRFTGTDPNFTVLVTVGRIQLVVPNRLLAFPWPRDAPGILVPCPNQEDIHPHADGCLDVGPGSAINLKIPLDDAPGDLSRSHFVADVALEFQPDGKWQINKRYDFLEDYNQVARRAPQHDVLGYDSFQEIPKPSILKEMSLNHIDEIKRTYLFIPKLDVLPLWITCTFRNHNDMPIDSSLCRTVYPFSPQNLSWPPYPEYSIRYNFPGLGFAESTKLGLWLGMRLRGLMRKPDQLWKENK